MTYLKPGLKPGARPRPRPEHRGPQAPQSLSVNRKPSFRHLIGTSVLALMLATHTLAAEGRDVAFDIKAQPLATALLAYSEQAGIQLILAADMSGVPASAGLRGTLDVEAALDTLLKGSELEYRFTSDNTVTVRKKSGLQAPTPPADPQGSPNPRAAAESRPVASFEEIVTIGTRSKGRTAIATPVPVDVVNSDALAATGQTETGRMLQMLAPSFNFSSSSVSDGTDALRPATLRGLGPDQTLVLVNGKRRHTSALVHVNTSVGRGTAGVDMNAIPGTALSRIEVLRDGAAAQYGSDAIAGVINLVLRNADEGGEANVSYGQTYEGDGATFTASVNAGFGLGDGGFVNVTGEYRDRGHTNRAGESAIQEYFGLNGETNCAAAADPSACYDPREYTFDRLNFRIGDADSEQTAFVLNAEVPVSETARFYAFGTYSDRSNSSAGFYRSVTQRNATVTELYPDGFLPLINTYIEDYSLSGGIEWELTDGWRLDTSVNHGANSFNFFISNSLNASFGAFSPTSADAGTLKIGQTTFNADLAKAFDLGGRDLSLAFGAEYREESYTLLAGEPVSYQDGGAVNTNCPGCDTNPVRYASGFQVFRGFAPANAVDEGRHNFSFYADAELQATEAWMIAAAARYEDYSDFGSTLTGKLSTRLELSPRFALRGSASTGFRAPSMQQKYFNSVSTQFVDVDGVVVAQERGTFRNDSAIAAAIGVPALKEETSLSFSGGFVATMGDLTFTADYYHIDIDDRIAISAAIDIAGLFPEASAATGATAGQFFINAADTSTQGVDLVATYDVPLSGEQSLKLSAAANWTETDLKEDTIRSSIGNTAVGPLFIPQDISIVEEWQPKTRVNLSADYQAGNWGLVARMSQFGSYTVCEGACDAPGTNVQTFGAKWIADLQLSYTFPDSGLKLSVGANNLLNTYPDENRIGQARGGVLPGITTESDGVFRYSRRAAPFGFNGGYWYARATYRF